MPKEIKRYETKDVWTNEWGGTYYPVFSEYKDGEWVKYSDHLKVVEELKKCNAVLGDHAEFQQAEIKELREALKNGEE